MRKLLYGSIAALVLVSLAVAQNSIVVRDGAAPACISNPNNCGVAHNFNVTPDGSGNLTWNYVGAPVAIPSTNHSQVIIAPLTYQTLLPAALYRSIIIQNNQVSGTDVCYILYGQNITSQIIPGTTLVSSNLTIDGNMVSAGGASSILNPGQPFVRFFPFTMSDPIFIACSTMGDTINAITQ